MQQARSVFIRTSKGTRLTTNTFFTALPLKIRIARLAPEVNFMKSFGIILRTKLNQGQLYAQQID
jgi:hypothetical protein